MPITVVSAVVLVDVDDQILIARRPNSKSMAGLWEFPGGKLQPDETPESALVRELKEELGIDTKASCLAPFTFTSHGYDDFHLLMMLFLCRRWDGIPQALEGQELKWVNPKRLGDYPMPKANDHLIGMLRDIF